LAFVAGGGWIRECAGIGRFAVFDFLGCADWRRGVRGRRNSWLGRGELRSYAGPWHATDRRFLADCGI